jgi:hypothetical protein
LQQRKSIAKSSSVPSSMAESDRIQTRLMRLGAGWKLRERRFRARNGLEILERAAPFLSWPRSACLASRREPHGGETNEQGLARGRGDARLWRTIEEA